MKTLTLNLIQPIYNEEDFSFVYTTVTKTHFDSLLDYTETPDYLFVTIVYDLKDSFKKIFKDARWDSAAKTWSIKNTETNFKNLMIFLDTHADTYTQTKATEAKEQYIEEKELQAQKREEAIIEEKRLEEIKDKKTELLNSIMNTKEVLNLFNTMKKAREATISTANRRIFEGCQEEFYNLYKEYKNKGYIFSTFYELSELNWNRKDFKLSSYNLFSFEIL